MKEVKDRSGVGVQRYFLEAGGGEEGEEELEGAEVGEEEARFVPK